MGQASRARQPCSRQAPPHGPGDMRSAVPRHRSRRARRPRPGSSRDRVARCMNHKGLDGAASAADQAARRRPGRRDRRARVRNPDESESPEAKPSRNRPSSPSAGRAARAGRRREKAPWRRSRAPATRGFAASIGPAHGARRRPAPATRRRPARGRRPDCPAAGSCRRLARRVRGGTASSGPG